MQRGFSLVELVLVILGLLTGGILAGQSLIRAAELRSVTTDYNRYTTAVQAFRDKYFALPGDMTNAQSFWGVAHATPLTCTTTVGTGTQTCNGNGDGKIANWATSDSAVAYEMWRFWQHLANAGLIEGSYSGVAGGGGVWAATLGTNAPRSKLNNAGWGIIWLGPWAGDAQYFPGNYGNYFSYGAVATNSFTYSPALKAEEAWNIDTKLDDGLPQSGRVVAFKNAYQVDCVAASNLAYNLSTTTTACALNFLPGL